MNQVMKTTNLDRTHLQDYGMKVQEKQGHFVYHPKKTSNGVFYLTKGYVRLVNEKQHAIRIVSPGEFFGDRSTFYSENVYAETITSAEYLFIDDEQFKQLLYNESELAKIIMNDLTDHSRYLNNQRTIWGEVKELSHYLQKGYSVKSIIWKNKMKKKDTLCCD
ncbi:Crp/Fnr family transcriptional regulator [Gracilibacillus sp. YIM 98692]|uniref:Crp/Fnr family transcriptional regulator n=1 Tax=Gracilibacillus sp. YIM 98692 TaxID=2663532 RepID=UPI0013D3ACEB|nr:Crp/Fnr family transcriptional regulator [Gracilibacillus sp. YIM 98692]